ncbi:hypothetical protein [Agrobacterium fabrum]|uniref:hypothetical protein n=1 Tax=Agrobacterium fabrum TaxID=1176649 RepID=UPI002476C9EA|nr:hypothetical protein [Agrobacterium fabrum]MDH6296588.1 hypothetical protein [Agrobacterium fabrum]
MQLEKIGQIFDTRSVSLPEGCISHAQSPQVLLIEDGVRIYFASRTIDTEGGKFRSRICFVDMDTNFQHVLRISREPVVPLGGLGCFDEHGIFPMNVIRRDNEVWGYTCGWNRRVSVSVDTGIGLVKSYDGGLTFKRYGNGPILGPSLNEPFLVGDAFVVQDKNIFYLWYMFGQRWVRESADAVPDRVYKIGCATSTDGVNFTKNDGVQILPDVLGPDECQALPSVVFFDGLWHMAFCYRSVHGFREKAANGYKVGYATSNDLTSWKREDATLGLRGTAGAWDSDMQCYPHLCVVEGKLQLLYNGNQFGKYGFGLARLHL